MKPPNLASGTPMLWATALLVAFLAGCASPPPEKSASEGQTVVATTPGAGTGAATAGANGSGVTGNAAMQGNPCTIRTACCPSAACTLISTA